MKPETREWLELSDMDLQMAEAGLERELYAPCVFHSQQAVEKALKAIWTEQRDEPPPRTHVLTDLATELGLTLESWEEFLASLSDQAVASRYSGKETYSRAEALRYYEGALELCALLRQGLK